MSQIMPRLRNTEIKHRIQSISPKPFFKDKLMEYKHDSKGYSIKTYHPGGDPTLKFAKPPLEVQLSAYRPTLESFSFNTYPPLEEIFISFRMVLVVCMYVCM